MVRFALEFGIAPAFHGESIVLSPDEGQESAAFRQTGTPGRRRGGSVIDMNGAGLL
jgi:hypothetical protein